MDSLLDLNGPSQSKDLIHAIKSLKVKYDEEIDKIKKTAEQRKSDDKSAECFYDGKLRKEIRGNYESYYICRCNPGYMGDNCQISKGLFDNTQTKLLGFLDEINKQALNPSRENRKKFLTALIMINKFRIGRPIIERMVDLVQNYLSKDKELDNRKKLYVFYDAILLNLFDSLEDMKKSSSQVYNADVDLQTERAEVYALIHRIIDMLEVSLEDHIYLNSFLEKHKSHYLGLDTYSFVISEYRLKKLDLVKGFSVHNPNIDTSFNVIENNRLQLDFEPRFDLAQSRHNVQMFTLAAPLFEDRLRSFGDVAVSNVLYFKYVNPKNPHEAVLHRDNKVTGMKVDFALTFIPAYDEILPNVACFAYYFGTDRSNVKGKALAIDEEKMVVTCEFPVYFEFKNYYFVISMKK